MATEEEIKMALKTLCGGTVKECDAAIEVLTEEINRYPQGHPKRTWLERRRGQCHIQRAVSQRREGERHEDER